MDNRESRKEASSRPPTSFPTCDKRRIAPCANSSMTVDRERFSAERQKIGVRLFFLAEIHRRSGFASAQSMKFSLNLDSLTSSDGVCAPNQRLKSRKYLLNLSSRVISPRERFQGRARKFDQSIIPSNDRRNYQCLLMIFRVEEKGCVVID